MQDGQSSNPSSLRRTNLHLVVSSFAALAGVAIAGYQTFFATPSDPKPVSLVVSLEPQKTDSIEPGSTIVKSDVPVLATRAVDLAQGAEIGAAMKDGSAGRYAFSSLFDGAPDTFVAIAPPDQDLTIQVMFQGGAAHEVTAIEYQPPAGVDLARMAGSVDVTVLPETTAGASGLQVFSFDLPQSEESRSFPIPGRIRATGVILNVKPRSGSDQSFVGDFRVLSETVSP